MDPKVEQFMGKVVGDASGFFSTLMAMIGDRYGLFKTLAEAGPLSPATLAERARLNERYVREWLGGMTTAGYVAYDPASKRFSLPPEHAPVLADEGGPAFLGGFFQEGFGALPNLPGVVEAFRTGGGVPLSSFGEEFWCGLSRLTAGWFEHQLLQAWLPSVPSALSQLQAGARFADVGSGHGYALLKLAEAFPRSEFVGYDIHEPNVKRASERAREAGLDGRLRFEVLDASRGIPDGFNVISTFDVVHDAVDPVGLLRSIRKALAPGGVYLCLDINCSERLEEMAGPLGTMFHGFSLMFCMTTSLARGGAGLGTVGLHEKKLHEIATEVGFSQVRRVPLENPFNSLYEVTP